VTTTVLRDLVARLGFQSDAKGFDEADRRIEKIKRELLGLNAVTTKGERAVTRAGHNAATAVENASRRARATASASGGGVLGTLGQFLAAGTIGAFIKGSLELASAVTEVDNVLETVFGQQGLQKIREWSAGVAEATGRSRFTLQKYASEVGTLLSTLIKDPDKLREMSTTLSGLAVDLASFRDTSPDEAIQAISSGLAGQSEPLRRYAVNILDAALNEFALTKGIHKKVEQMKLAEKSELIYAKILHDTALMQGDATKTAKTFANRLRALNETVKDLRISIGRGLLPAGNDLLAWAIKASQSFVTLNESTYFLKTAIIALGAAFAVMWGRAFVGALPMIALIAALYLAFDEIYTLAHGGNTLLGDFLKELYGEDEGKRKIEAIRDSIKSLGEAIKWLGEQIAKLPSMPSLPAWVKRTSEIYSNAGGSLVTKDEFERIKEAAYMNEEREAIISQNAYNAERRALGQDAPMDSEVPEYMPSRADRAVLDAAARKRHGKSTRAYEAASRLAAAEGLVIDGPYAHALNPRVAGPSAAVSGASSVTINEAPITVNVGTDTNGEVAGRNVRQAAVEARNTRRTVTRNAPAAKP
jgi:hypothetical protein